jgi:nucleobase:cation symporter-1, NCS1 family
VTYGSHVAAVEPHALDPIDARERHGRPRDLFPLWFGANAETATFAVGILAVALYGTSLTGALAGLFAGNVLGYAVVGLASRGGPRFGLPQMVVSRRVFGVDGNALPAVLAFLAGVGWFAVESVFGAQALGALFGLPYPLALAALLLAQVAIAVYGHNAIHAFERAASVVLVIGFSVVATAVFAHGPLVNAFDPRAPLAAGGELAGVAFSATLAFAYAVGWAPCASDYARYLPAASNARAVAAWAFAGGIIPSMLLEGLGASAAIAIHAPGFASATPAETIRLVAQGNPWITAIGLVTVLVGTLSANALNLYSGALSALVAYDARRRLGFALFVGVALGVLTAIVLVSAEHLDSALRLGASLPAYALAIGGLAFVVVRWTLRRWQAAIAVGILGGALALAGADPVATARLVTSFLGMLTMWAAPWAGVVLASRFSTNGASDRAAVLAWVAGIAASLPFWQQSWFVGPVATANPQLGDVSFFVAFAVSYSVALAGAGRAAPRLGTKASP